MNVVSFFLTVGPACHSRFMKSRLPHRHLASTNPVKFMRAATLNQLHCSFKADSLRWSQNQMQMIWHYNKLVQQIISFLAIPSSFATTTEAVSCDCRIFAD